VPPLPSQSRLTASAAALVIAYAAALAAYIFGLSAPVQNAENSTLDWRFLWRGPVGPKAESIVLVTLEDGDSLAYRNPLPRQRLAEIIGRLEAGGADLIGLDVFLDRHSFDAAGDTLLREAMARSGRVVLVSQLERGGPCGWTPRRALPFFGDVALDHGYATFFTDTAGEFVREGQVALPCQSHHFLSFAAVLYNLRQRGDPALWRALGPAKLHDGPGAYLGPYRRLIDFSGPPQAYYRNLDHEMPGGFSAFASRQVLAMPPALLNRLFSGRIVLVGSDMDDAPDRFRTPYFSSSYGPYLKTSGVEIQAHFLRSLLDQTALERAGFWVGALAVLVPALLTAWGGIRFKTYWALPLALGVSGANAVAALCFFSWMNIALPMVQPALAVVFSTFGALAYLAATQGRQHGQVRERFGPMVAADRLASLVHKAQGWSDEGVERSVAVVWIHCTASSDSDPDLPTHQKLTWLRAWWERASGVVFAGDGMVFRFEPDSMAVVFGAPLSQADCGVRAVEAARGLFEAFVELRAAESGGSHWLCRIGVDCGQALMGEIAGGARLATRVLGRPVERAGQIANASGDEGVYLTEAVRSQAGAEMAVQKVDSDGFEAVFRLQEAAVVPSPKQEHPFWKYRPGATRRPGGDIEAFVAGMEIFADFSRRDLRHISPLFYARSYAAGETVFNQGEVGSAMYVLRTGGCDIVQGESRVLLQRLEPGDFFGELALLSDLRRSATAVANRPTQMLVLFQSELFELIERRPELGVRLIRTLSRVLGERLARFNERVDGNGATT
jgi:CRP/FNR family transcriptional regulator, cyclic AMP receptor protein